MDLLDMLRDQPVEFDIRSGKQIAFVGDKSTIEDVSLVIYEDSNYQPAFTGDEIKKLVASRKMDGVIIPNAKVRDMAVLLLDSYSSLMDSHASLEERLKVAQRINDLLETMRLL